MSAVTETKQWITGEEFARERRRLLDAGYGSATAQYQALMRRLDERNNYIWRTYGVPLIEQHRGKWAAITTDGDFLLADSELEVIRQSREQFGPANALVVRLNETRGAYRIGPRSG